MSQFRWPWRAEREVRAEVDDELAFHLEQRTAELAAGGLDRATARAQALKEFGNLEAARRSLQRADVAHEQRQRWLEWLNDLGRDVRYAWRTIRGSPAFAIATVLMLALGIGANTAIYTLVRGILLRPLPYRESERLFTAFESDSSGGFRLASYPTFRDWATDSSLVDGMSFQRGTGITLKGSEGSEIVLSAYVSDGFFPLLGTSPARGRWIQPDDERPGAPAVMVISHSLWWRRFGGDPGILGQTVQLAEGPTTVIGVMPMGFAFPSWANAWLPLQTLPEGNSFITRRDLHVDSRVLVRIRRDQTPEMTQARLSAVARRLAEVYPENARFTSVTLQSLNAGVLGNTTQVLLLFGGAVVCVLLIACANLANLSLVRSLGRGREMAIRAALGAGRARVIRQLLTESAILALAGGMLGLIVAYAVVAWIKQSAQFALPRLDEVQLDLPVAAFMLGLAVFCVLLFGLWPALRASSPNLADGLRDRSGGGGSSGGKARSAIVLVQVALAVMLLAGAGLLIRSAVAVDRINPGFNPQGLVIFRVNPPSPRYDDSARAALLYRELAEAAAAIPGVSQAALSNHVPMHGAAMPTQVRAAGAPNDPATLPLANLRTVSPEYFATVETTVVQGRGFLSTEMTSSSTAMLVNETLARQLWPGTNAVGQRLTVLKAAQGRSNFQQPVAGEVVGVVRDVRHFGLETPPPTEVYLPYPVNVWRSMFLVVRTAQAPERIIPALRQAIRRVDPDIPVDGVDTFAVVDDLFAQTRAPRRLSTFLLGGFAGAALLLAAIGLYGLIAYSVWERRRDFGLRLALGADPAGLVRTVVVNGLGLVAIGVAIGLVSARLGSNVMRGLVFGVSPNDNLTFVLVPIALLGISFVATLIPARRAAKVDPLVVLRSD